MGRKVKGRRNLYSSTVTGGIINILFVEVFRNIEKQMESFYFKSGFG